MDVYGPLRVTLFVYDLFRLLILIGVITVFFPLNEILSSGSFPYLLYVVPNALFPLMACFLWLQLASYKPYISLYMAGKTIAVASLVVWYVFSFRALATEALLEMLGSMVLLGVTLFLLVADALSVLGMRLLQNRLRLLELAAAEGGGV
jgi:hypothetical protein